MAASATSAIMGPRGVRLAVVGCCHGTLHAIYSSIAHASRVKGWAAGVDLVVICGDFQAVRNTADLHAMAVPAKYRALGDFHAYYSGERKVPYLTIFIGGNHEASNHLMDLYYGGWVAPNIYYLGAANVVNFGGLRISGASGIWKGHDYRKPHYERAPYGESEKRSVYHIRELDVRKLLQVRTQVDIGLSHDWPRGIEWVGDSRTLFQHKQFLEADARKGELGSTAAKYLLDHLKAPYWFSAHLHCKYSAVVHWDKKSDGSVKGSDQPPEAPPTASAADGATANADEIDVDLESEGEKAPKAEKPPAANEATTNADEIDVDLESDSEEQPKAGEQSNDKAAPNSLEKKAQNPRAEVPDELRAQLPDSFKRTAPAALTGIESIDNDIKNKKTRFLALDKCLPKRHFVQLLEIQPLSETHMTPQPEDGLSHLSYDKEWLAITRVFAKELQLGRNATVAPDQGIVHYRPLIEAEEEWLERNLGGNLRIPENFQRTAPTHDPATSQLNTPEEYRNPQTDAFCKLIGIANPFESAT